MSKAYLVFEQTIRTKSIVFGLCQMESNKKKIKFKLKKMDKIKKKL